MSQVAGRRSQVAGRRSQVAGRIEMIGWIPAMSSLFFNFREFSMKPGT